MRVWNRGLARLLALAVLVSLCGHGPAAAAETKASGVIAVLGSSVAKGHGCSGNCSGNIESSANGGDGGCYQTKLKRAQLGARLVLNSARNGDDTGRALSRLPGTLGWINDQAALLNANVVTNNRFVLVGLSLANQGYNGVTYRSGIREIIRQVREAGMIPVIGLCYANGYSSSPSYRGPAGYTLTKTINIEIQQLDNITSVNFLGGVDNGHGGWAGSSRSSGFYNDGGHPNDAGQIEMYYTIPPSLFDALALGKQQPRNRTRDPDGVDSSRLTAGSTAVGGWVFAPKTGDTMHSFTVSLEIRAHGNVKLCSINTTATPTALPLIDIFSKAGERRLVSINRNTGFLAYVDADGVGNGETSSWLLEGSHDLLDGEWHMVTVTHHWAREETLIYIDGSLLVAGTGGAIGSPGIVERLAPLNISLLTSSLGDGWASRLDDFMQCRDWMIYRAGLNEDEVRFLWQNKAVLKGSLEIFAPLHSASPGLNVAQTLSEMRPFSSHAKGTKNWTTSRLRNESETGLACDDEAGSSPSPSTGTSHPAKPTGPSQSSSPSSSQSAGSSPSVNSGSDDSPGQDSNSPASSGSTDSGTSPETSPRTVTHVIRLSGISPIQFNEDQKVVMAFRQSVADHLAKAACMTLTCVPMVITINNVINVRACASGVSVATCFKHAVRTRERRLSEHCDVHYSLTMATNSAAERTRAAIQSATYRQESAFVSTLRKNLQASAVASVVLSGLTADLSAKPVEAAGDGPAGAPPPHGQAGAPSPSGQITPSAADETDDAGISDEGIHEGASGLHSTGILVMGVMLGVSCGVAIGVGGIFVVMRFRDRHHEIERDSAFDTHKQIGVGLHLEMRTVSSSSVEHTNPAFRRKVG